MSRDCMFQSRQFRRQVIDSWQGKWRLLTAVWHWRWMRGCIEIEHGTGRREKATSLKQGVYEMLWLGISFSRNAYVLVLLPKTLQKHRRSYSRRFESGQYLAHKMRRRQMLHPCMFQSKIAYLRKRAKRFTADPQQQ